MHVASPMNIPSQHTYDPTPVSPATKRVLVVDDHQLICEGIAEALDEVGGFDVDWTLKADHLREKIDTHDYDLVILDTRLPDPVNVAYVEQVVAQLGAAPLLLLAETVHAEFLDSVLEVGAAGVIEKNVKFSVFINVISLVLAGGQYMPRSAVGADAKAPASGMKISRQEQAVLRLAAEGFSDKLISFETNLKISQVKSAFVKLRMKLEARNRTHAVMIARQCGII